MTTEPTNKDRAVLTIVIILVAILAGCSTPTEPTESEMSTDSLLAVIDTLQIQLGRTKCRLRCLQDTLNSLNITAYCKCGV